MAPKPEETEAAPETGDVEMKDQSEEPKEPEPQKEQEQDAPADKRAKVKAGAVALSDHDSTINAVQVNKGKVLMPLTEGGMQYLLAGARSNAGIKSGRYMFEVRIIESLNPYETQGNQRTPMPRQLVRLGFSLPGSSLLLADGAGNCCFDSEGFFTHDKSRKKIASKFTKDQAVAVLLNLDSSSPNANTVSLFVEGVRASDPVPLPESFRGKVLVPTVTYKNVSLEVNLGPTPRVALPFVCRMVADAASDDLEILQLTGRKDGKCEVVFPVGLPEQGYFDWVDQFLEKNPGYVELSSRKILEWASKSGCHMQRQQAGGASSQDKPEARFGVADLDDWSAQKVISTIAPTLQKNYVVAELKSNLTESDRARTLLRFGSGDFHRKAVVIMGQPDKEFKDAVQSRLLDEKKAKAEVERKRKAAEKERARQAEERKKEAEARKKRAEADRKAREIARKKAAGEEVEEMEVTPETEEAKEEPKAEDEAKEEEEEAPVELTEEEKQTVFRKTAIPDLSETDLLRSYQHFSLPAKAEGFDDVTYAWQEEKETAELFKAYVHEKKMNCRAEDLEPGADFKERWAKWGKTVQEWRRIQTDFKDPAKRKAAKEKKAAEAKKKLEEEKAKLLEAGDEDGAKALEENAAKEAAPAEVDVENLDAMQVEDITDIGNGEPLFLSFTYEDWTLLSVRYELSLLAHSFKKDLNDADRPGFQIKDLGYYYQKYYRKTWNFAQFGVKEFEDLVDLMKESVSVDSSTGHLKAEQDEDIALEHFVKLTEDNRRERQRRIDAGDETGRIKFTRPSPGKAGGKGGGGGGAGGGGAYGKGGGGGAGGGGAYGHRRPAPAGAPYPPAKHARGAYGGGAPGGPYSRR
eukprot:TRINITY_DN16912_c0_g1_i1.p1 TRINITY_DN16912_c0_g1~~TRINITY_DN16912_c0_g1_i1.p1  ORF type:complete len:871 (-),score=228.44 TRINITY_DN16912_c0_g1_i1:111-2696(-)